MRLPSTDKEIFNLFKDIFGIKPHPNPLICRKYILHHLHHPGLYQVTKKYK